MCSQKKPNSILKVGVVALAAVMCVVLPAAAENGDEPGKKSKLQVHGFLTQAWATGSNLTGGFPNPDGSPAGLTIDELSLGIPEDGTTSYRNMAIQFRYEISDKDIMLVQLSSRALGNSPTTDTEDEVELDWAFYERRLADNTSLKVGRVQIPHGIFNEIRDVGTILPFYRPAFNVYQEGANTSETVDGLALSHTFAPASDWSVDATLYFGEWELVEINPSTFAATESNANDAYGTQLWLNTPIYGLRFGAAFQHYGVTGGDPGLRPPGNETVFDDWLFSVDAAFDKWVFRTEYRSVANDPDVFPIFGVDDFEVIFDFFYAQVGWHVSPKVRLYAQYEQSDLTADSRIFTSKHDHTTREDLGFAFNYVFSSNLVLKAEYHDVSGRQKSFMPAFTPAGFRLQPIFRDLDGGDYTIISLSASF